MLIICAACTCTIKSHGLWKSDLQTTHNNRDASVAATAAAVAVVPAPAPPADPAAHWAGEDGEGISAKTIKLPYKSISVSGPAPIPSLLVDNAGDGSAAPTGVVAGDGAGAAAGEEAATAELPPPVTGIPFGVCWHLQANLSLQYVRL